MKVEAQRVRFCLRVAVVTGHTTFGRSDRPNDKTWPAFFVITIQGVEGRWWVTTQASIPVRNHDKRMWQHRPHGGPGAGKTTLLHALRSHGYTVVDETARALIQGRRSRALSPRPPPLEFAEDVLRNDIEQYARHSPRSGYVFFDRGVLDALCMLDQVKPLQRNELAALVSQYPYSPQVFFLPPWEAIYSNDAERDQTFTEAIRVYETLAEWYRRCSYEVVEVPKGTVAERCAHVLNVLAMP